MTKPTKDAAAIPPPKESISIRLDGDVLRHFRATGPRWQTRINAVLRAYVKAKGK